jgi:hypothetical protein
MSKSNGQVSSTCLEEAKLIPFVPTTSNEPEVQNNSRHLVNNLGLSDSDFGLQWCATNIKPYVSVELGSMCGVALPIDSNKQVDKNELSCIVVDQLATLGNDMAMNQGLDSNAVIPGETANTVANAAESNANDDFDNNEV